VAVDLNRDGRIDLATANIAGEDVSILIGMGGARFASQLRVATMHPANSIAGIDLNFDGIPDLVTTSTEGTVSVLLGR
jgi:hypothetical protein